MGSIHTADFESPFGTMRLASSDVGLVYLQLPRASGRGLAGWLNQYAADEEIREGYEPNRDAVLQITEYLNGKREAFDLALDLRATPFQRRVYDALLEVPYGETRTYSDIAAVIGADNAVRAVGTANGANPISLIVPCHRVVAKGGKLGGYAGGLPMKEKLLAMEHKRPAQGALL